MSDLALFGRGLAAAAVIVVWFAFMIDRRRRGWWALALALAAGVGAWRLSGTSAPASRYVAARPLPAYQVLAPEDVTLTGGAAPATPTMTVTTSLTATPSVASPAEDDFNPIGQLLLTAVEAGAPILPTQVLSIPQALQPRYFVDLTLDSSALPGSGLQAGAQVDIHATARRLTPDDSFSLSPPDIASLFPITRALVLASAADEAAQVTTLTLGLREAATVEQLLAAGPYVTFQLALHAPPSDPAP